MDMQSEASVKAIAELAKAQVAEIVNTPGLDGASIPLGRVISVGGASTLFSIKPLLDEWAHAPDRTKGTAKVSTLDAFVSLTNRHKNESSAIFGTIGASPSVTSVIDYTGLDHAPAFGGHRVVYPFPMSPEWQAWRGCDAKNMTQLEWAAFIEEHVADLAAPMDAEVSEYEAIFQTKIAIPTELLMLSRGMQINVEARVKEARTLQSGESEILYEEVHKDGSGQKLVVPGLFVIRIPLFLDGEQVRIIARLRYRQNDGRLTWFYQMYRPDLVMRARLREDFDKIASETSLPVYEGSPEA